MSEKVTLECPYCKHRCKIYGKHLGRKVTCPRCSQVFNTSPPKPSTPTPTPKPIPEVRQAAPPPAIPAPEPEPQPVPDPYRQSAEGFSSSIPKLRTEPKTRYSASAVKLSVLRILQLTFSMSLRDYARVAWSTLIITLLNVLIGASLLGLICVPFVAMGYICYLANLVERKPASMQQLLAFFRHGWDALWHSVMIFVAQAILLAEIVLGAALLIVALGLPAILLALLGFNETSVLGVIIAAYALFVTVVITAAAIFGYSLLSFCLLLDAATRPPRETRRFELVYRAFGKTQQILDMRKRELITCVSCLIGTTLIAGGLVALIMLVPVLITNQPEAVMAGVGLSILITLPLILVIWPVFLTRTAIELLKTVPGEDD